MLTAMRGANNVKLVAVTPKAAVSPDPRAEPAKEPPLRIDIKVANNVASTPCKPDLALSRRPYSCHGRHDSKGSISEALHHKCRNHQLLHVSEEDGHLLQA